MLGLAIVTANVPVACAVADIKILPLAYEPKAEERYLPEPLQTAAIAQLPPVSGGTLNDDSFMK